MSLRRTLDLSADAALYFDVLIECGSCEEKIRMDEAVSFGEPCRETFVCDHCGAKLIVRIDMSLEFQTISTRAEVDPCNNLSGKCAHDWHCKRCMIGMADQSNAVKVFVDDGSLLCSLCGGALT